MISFSKIMKRKLIKKDLIQSDIIGAVASTLCAIHCIMTPFLFAIQSCSSTSCCSDSPSWWSSLDYIFIIITLFAVYHSSQNTSTQWMKQSLYATWVVMTLLILNEKVVIVNIESIYKYVITFGLIGLHTYNLKYCQCSNDSCCIGT